MWMPSWKQGLETGRAFQRLVPGRLPSSLLSVTSMLGDFLGLFVLHHLLVVIGTISSSNLRFSLTLMGCFF